jgi:hypothetical protein
MVPVIYGGRNRDFRLWRNIRRVTRDWTGLIVGVKMEQGSDFWTNHMLCLAIV